MQCLCCWCYSRAATVNRGYCVKEAAMKTIRNKILVCSAYNMNKFVMTEALLETWLRNAFWPLCSYFKHAPLLWNKIIVEFGENCSTGWFDVFFRRRREGPDKFQLWMKKSIRRTRHWLALLCNTGAAGLFGVLCPEGWSGSNSREASY